MRIAVLGGGNGAFAAVADLTVQGHEVRHWRRDTAALRPRINLKDARGIREIGIAKACADAQVVFLSPGTFGAYAMTAILREAGSRARFAIADAGPLEHFERWDIHKEGTQPSIRRVTDALDAERIAARTALGAAASLAAAAAYRRLTRANFVVSVRETLRLTVMTLFVIC